MQGDYFVHVDRDVARPAGGLDRAKLSIPWEDPFFFT